MARYTIPVRWIDGKDLPDEQLLEATEYMRQHLSCISMFQIGDMKHAVGYRVYRVKVGQYHAFLYFLQ